MIDSWCVADSHGTRYAYYSRGCRCAAARADCAAYQRERVKRTRVGRPMSVPAVGTIRRLQALSRMGWTFREIGGRSGAGRKYLMQLATAGPMEGRVYASLATPVDRVFRDLCMVPGPSARARSNAVRHGWAPPLAWDNIDDPDEKPSVPTTRLARMADLAVDEVAVQRAARGERLRLNAMERAATVGLLAREGMSDRLIAERMGLTPRSVLRIRTKDGVAAVHDPAGNRVTA